MRYLFYKILKLLSKLSGKEIYYYSKNENNIFGKTAVKASPGFWYVGNVLSPQDIAYGILNNGVIEPEGASLVKEVLEFLLEKKGNLTFYDIGANTGYYGILASFLGKGRIKTFAFEPIKEFNDVERETIKLNSLEDVCSVFELAVGSEPGEQEIYLSGTGSTLNHEFLGKKNAKKRLIKKDTLDNIILNKSLPAPDFLKIDVESLKYEVLLGAKLTLESAKPVVWYESALTVKQNNYTNDNFFATQELLSGLGYEIFLQQGKGLVKARRAVGDGVEMYLALHREKHNFILKNFEIVEK